MGKKKTSKENEEPLFTPLKTTDDDDDDIENAGPPTRYQDNPNTSPNHKDDDMNGPPISYRDEPGSIFDWDDGTPTPTTSSSSSKKKKKHGKNKKVKDLLDDQEAEDEEEEEVGDDIYQIDDTFNPDGGGFSPVSLHDDDSDDDDDDNDENVRLTAGGGASDEEQGAAQVRRKANKLLNQRVFDETTYDDTDDRIFVGGGWGRHGSQFSLCPRGCCATLCCCCCRSKQDASSYSRGPQSSKLKSGGLCKMVCVGMAFLVLVFGSGYLGYEAGLPIEEEDGVSSTGEDGGKNSTSSGGAAGMAAQQHHAHTKGEQWVEWLEHEKEEVHMPHFNFTFKRPHRPHGHSKDGDKQQRPQIFQPKTQVELLHMSENIFQSCSERSLRTKAGRDACNSLCHGHYCCFEKDAVFGSCVATPNAYCFAYAACENIVTDFGMDNVNTLIKDTKKEPAVGQQVHDDHDGGQLNANDLQLLKDTCSVENIATLDGIRDCTTFCEHHLCCFNSLESENCSKEYKGECLAYDACKILFFGPEAEGVDVQGGSQTTSSSSAGGGGNSGGNYQVGPPSAQTTTANGNNNAAAVAVKASFKDECMSNNIKENWETCRSHCEEFECCFSQNDSCYKDQSLVCDEYYICEEFYFEQEEEEYKEQFGDSSDAVETVNQSPSLSNNQASGGSSNLSAQKDAVHAVCSLVESSSESDPMVTACHALCANYLCCFSQSGTQSNCRATYGEDTCNAFMECSVLTGVFDDFNPNSGSVAGGPPAPGASNQADVLAVKQSCVAKARRDPWVAEQCRKACDVRWCCYQSEGPGNCNAINQEWCDEFEACDVIYGG